MKYHLEIIKIRNNGDSAICHLWAFTETSIRLALNIPISYFHTGNNITVNDGLNGIKMKLIRDNKQLIIEGFAMNDISFQLDSCRSVCMEVDRTPKSTVIISGNMPIHLNNQILVNNRKIKDRLNG
jgi:hypothetical protein